MVGSSTSEAERRYWKRVLGLGFVAVVALSAATIAVHGGATALEIGVVTAVGASVGTGLVWYLARIDLDRNRGGRRRNR